MKTVTFKDYEDAKNEIIRGIEYKEYSDIKHDGRIAKQYIANSIGGGVFYELTDKGITEFWSTKHPESRYYDDRSREEIITQYEERIAAIVKEWDEYRDDTNKMRMRVMELEKKLAAINAMAAA